MNGKEIYRFAVQKVPEVIEKALFRANLGTDEIDWLLLHQANQRILDAVAQRLNIPAEKVLSNLARYGNTSAASIPLALDEAVREGKIQPGDVIVASGFGAGLTWGAAIFQWGK
jgi:3-oxoacyl-[acyl-carrier-protein] synthase-3